MGLLLPSPEPLARLKTYPSILTTNTFPANQSPECRELSLAYEERIRQMEAQRQWEFRRLALEADYVRFYGKLDVT